MKKVTNHDFIRMIAFVRCQLSSNREALYAEIKILTYNALNADLPGNIFVAIITVVKRYFSFIYPMAYSVQNVGLL